MFLLFAISGGHDYICSEFNALLMDAWIFCGDKFCCDLFCRQRSICSLPNLPTLLQFLLHLTSFLVMNQSHNPGSRLQNLILQILMSLTHLLQFQWTILMDLIFLVYSLLVLIQLLQNQLKVLLKMAALTIWTGSLWQAPILHRRRVSRWSLEYGQIRLAVDWLILIYLLVSISFSLAIVSFQKHSPYPCYICDLPQLNWFYYMHEFMEQVRYFFLITPLRIGSQEWLSKSLVWSHR